MKNKKLKVLLMTGVLTLGLCVGCGNSNNEELTSLQEKYDNSQKIVEQYKKDNEKLKEQNKALEQDKRTAESKLKELQSKEEPADATENTTEDAATESSNNDVWYTCEKCGVTNGKVKLHGAFYMCPNCIAKQDNSSNTTTRRNTNNYNKKHNNHKDNYSGSEVEEGCVYCNGGRSSSNKYHSSAHAHGMKDAIKMTKKQAEASGYIACKRCY